MVTGSDRSRMHELSIAMSLVEAASEATNERFRRALI